MTTLTKNELVFVGNVPMMSSREIGELTGKEHKNVIRDIRTMLDSLQEDGSNLSHQFREEKDARGYTSMFHIDRELTDTLLTGYSIPLRRKVIARWHEFEAGKAQPKELSRMEILKLAMESEQARIEAEKQLALAAPKVEFVDRYVEATGLFTFREVAKLLKANEARFREFLLVEKIMYRLGTGGKLTAYQNHVDAGRFEMKTDTAKNGHSYRSSMFTAKGVHWIAGEWANANLEVAA